VGLVQEINTDHQMDKNDKQPDSVKQAKDKDKGKGNPLLKSRPMAKGFFSKEQPKKIPTQTSETKSKPELPKKTSCVLDEGLELDNIITDWYGRFTACFGKKLD